jgi:hypothetical protein
LNIEFENYALKWSIILEEFRTGKLETENLRRLLKCIKKTPEVIVPPTPGFDSGVHKIGDGECLVVSTDPCIGVPKDWFGWFLINYAASDVEVFGAQPQYAIINLLAPLGTPVEGFQPAKEMLAFVNLIPKTKGKKAILFCTYTLWKGITFGILSRHVRRKGYECVLRISKKKVVPGQTDFSDVAEKVAKALDHTRFANWFSTRRDHPRKQRVWMLPK